MGLASDGARIIGERVRHASEEGVRGGAAVLETGVGDVAPVVPEGGGRAAEGEAERRIVIERGVRLVGAALQPEVGHEAGLYGGAAGPDRALDVVDDALTD